ncbi:MAG: hypothetical protein V4736_04235 [Bdellovibrionota bacterium]
MNKDIVELKTMDNTKVSFLRGNVGAVEEIPASSRTEGYIKVYVSGYAFQIAMTYEEVLKVIYGE